MFRLRELGLHVVKEMTSWLPQNFEYGFEGGEVLHLEDYHVCCEEELVVAPAPGYLGVGWKADADECDGGTDTFLTGVQGEVAE